MRLILFLIVLLLSCKTYNSDFLQNNEAADVSNVAASHLENVYKDEKVSFVLNVNTRVDELIEMLDEDKPYYLQQTILLSQESSVELSKSKSTISRQLQGLNALNCDNLKINKKFICYSNFELYPHKKKGDPRELKNPFIYLSKPFFTVSKDYAIIFYSIGTNNTSQSALMILKYDENSWVFKERMIF
ncbi:hypothetical protein JM84_0982 [Dokdonia sp. Hel_I_63]|nr:hypothetical protein Krodi_0689 [Dokdonia sp. 4H-3-7-5]TVZ22098.1 hypothetical protein JM84_0982 [Dokdonia sp. Hel_I_63]